MRTYMIGSGAMGSCYGGLLARAGYDVTLIDPREDHIALVRRNGLIVDGVRGRHVRERGNECRQSKSEQDQAYSPDQCHRAPLCG